MQAAHDAELGESKAIAAAFKTQAALAALAAGDDDASGEPELDPAAFKALVRKLLSQGGATAETMPSEESLDEIFVIADKDKSGAVDEDEFVALYALIKTGQVRDGSVHPGVPVDFQPQTP